MSRKSKIDPIVKVKIVEQYLDGEIGLGQASKNLGVAYQSIRKWISIYQCNGPTGLLNQPKNKSYSKALKISAVPCMGYARKDVEKTKKLAKKFVRYQEGAELYSIGLTKFQEIVEGRKTGINFLSYENHNVNVEE